MRLTTRRAHRRFGVHLEAQLITARGVTRALLQDLSEKGAKLVLVHAPDLDDDDVVLRWACYTAVGRIAWVRGQECGLEFDARLDPRVVAATQEADFGR